MCLCVQGYMCIYAFTETRGVCLNSPLPCLLRQGLSLNLKLTDLFSSGICLPASSTDVTDKRCCSWMLWGCPGSKPRPSRLPSKPVANGALSSALPFSRVTRFNFYLCHCDSHLQKCWQCVWPCCMVSGQGHSHIQALALRGSLTLGWVMAGDWENRGHGATLKPHFSAWNPGSFLFSMETG